MKLRTILAVACVCVLAAPAFCAAPLADRLPAGTLVYLGWAGKTEAFDQSTLGQLLREPVADQIVQAIRKAGEENLRADERKVFQTVWDLASVTWKHPIAAALVDMRVDKQAPPQVSGALLVDLGDDRAKFAADLDTLLDLAKKEVPTAEAELPGGLKYRKLVIRDEGAPPIGLGYMGNTFFLCVGKDMPAALADVQADKSLQNSADFKARFAQVDGPDVLGAMYVDLAGILKRLEPMMGPLEQPEGKRGPTPRRVLAALGLDKLQACAGTARIVDKSLYCKAKLFTPAPHQGPLMLFAGGKLTDKDLAGVPADADFFVAGKLSPEAVYKEIRRVIGQIDPNAQEKFLKGVNEAEKDLKVSLTKDFLPAMGDTWVLSSAPSQGGFLTGTVLTVTLKDPQKFASAIAAIEDAIKKQMAPPEAPPSPDSNQPPPRGRPRAGSAIESVKIDGLEVHYVSFSGLPVPVAPAWAVHKDKFYLAAWPQVVATAIANEGKAPITKDAAFAANRKRMAKEPSWVSYCNVPRIVRELYNVALVGWTVGANMLSRETGVAVKPDWLPVLSKLEKYLSPSSGAVSADDEGITFESFGSLPSGAAAVPVAAGAALFVIRKDTAVKMDRAAERAVEMEKPTAKPPAKPAPKPGAEDF